jgi:hypothetical protein
MRPMLRALLHGAGGMTLGWCCWNAAQYYWNEAHLPMTQEKYDALCGRNASECYPEIGDMLLAYFFGGGVILAVALIVRACAIAWRELINGSTRRAL